MPAQLSQKASPSATHALRGSDDICCFLVSGKSMLQRASHSSKTPFPCCPQQGTWNTSFGRPCCSYDFLVSKWASRSSRSGSPVVSNKVLGARASYGPASVGLWPVTDQMFMRTRCLEAHLTLTPEGSAGAPSLASPFDLGHGGSAGAPDCRRLSPRRPTRVPNGSLCVS